MDYVTLKTLHILSMVLLFGTGLGSAYYKWMADRSRDVGHIAMTNRHVVWADWLFTTPTVIFQPISGLWMVKLAEIPWTSGWIVASVGLYLLAGLCWLPVVWLQMRMRDVATRAHAAPSPLPPEYWRMAQCWFWLGVPAFAAMVLVVALMVFKHLPGGPAWAV